MNKALYRLRKLAEEELAIGGPPLENMGTLGMSTVIEELRIHQVEIELQNEELRRSQEETQKVRARYEDLWQLSPVGYVILDEFLRIKAVNRSAQELFNRSRDVLLESPFTSFLLSDNQVAVHLLLEMPTAGEIFPTHKVYLVRRDGSFRTCQLICKPFIGESGEKNIQVVLTDISELEKAHDILEMENLSERKQAREEKRRLQAQLQQSQKMEAIGTLAGGIAHDFNNILAIILGNAELASNDVPDSNPASEFLKEIRRASIRAKNMVRQLLSFSHKTEEESSPIDMAPIIKESMKMLRSAIPASVEFKLHISNDLCSVMGDASQINQIVMNLVTNAVDAMSKLGGVLDVTLKNIILHQEKTCFGRVLSPGPYVRLRMRDRGEGIEPEIVDRIFEPYFTTKEVGKGTGMGLSVIHGIVKRHGGGILVESELGKGTVFEIYFPALENKTEVGEEPDGEIKRGSERVLFVDDEESMVNLNRKRLERLGYQVKSTAKPEEALEWFKADPEQFDVLLTDMTMPRMSGDRLAAEVLKIRPNMPVIICTGYSERMSAQKAEVLGVRKYIEKPIDLRNLASALREVLDEK